MLSRIPKSSLRALSPRQIFPSVRRRLSSLPKAVLVSPVERQSGTLSWRNLELATRALQHDGIVVLEDAIPHAKLDFLNEKMVKDALFLQSAGDAIPFNYNKGFFLSFHPTDSLGTCTNMTKEHPARPSISDKVLRPKHLPQPPRHPSHFLRTRPSPQTILHIRQQRTPTNARLRTPLAARALRRRLRTPSIALRARCKRPAGRDDTRERLYGSLARVAFALGKACAGGRAWRESERSDQEGCACGASARAASLAAGRQAGLDCRAGFAVVACGEAELYSADKSHACGDSFRALV